MTNDVLRRLHDIDPASDVPALTPDRTAALLARAVCGADNPAAAPRPTTRPAVAVGTPRGWGRRLVVVAAVATALPVAATLLTPVISSRLGPDGLLAGTAVAGDGGLTCGEGYSRPIRPDTADPRPWPQQLPAGWSAQEVYARAYTGAGWCTTPSLNAATVDASGLVTGNVSITGPARRIDVGDGGAPTTDDRIGPYAARRLDPYGGAPTPVDADPDRLHEWIITDAGGEQWFAVVNGYTAMQGRELLAAATLRDGMLTWDTTRAPQLQVLHRRTGAPYPLETTDGQDWYLRLDANGRPVTVQAFSGRAGGGALNRTGPGSRLVTVAGQPGLVIEDYGRPVSVVADLAGAVVSADVVDGDVQQTLDLLASLTSLDADDARLDDLALDEDYEP